MKKHVYDDLTSSTFTPNWDQSRVVFFPLSLFPSFLKRENEAERAADPSFKPMPIPTAKEMKNMEGGVLFQIATLRPPTIRIFVDGSFKKYARKTARKNDISRTEAMQMHTFLEVLDSTLDMVRKKQVTRQYGSAVFFLVAKMSLSMLPKESVERLTWAISQLEDSELLLPEGREDECFPPEGDTFRP